MIGRVPAANRFHLLIARYSTKKIIGFGPDEVGEIVCRGPQTMAYYWNRPEATEKVFRNGWLHTGDLGYRDSEGFYYLVDRKKRYC